MPSFWILSLQREREELERRMTALTNRHQNLGVKREESPIQATGKFKKGEIIDLTGEYVVNIGLSFRADWHSVDRNWEFRDSD